MSRASSGKRRRNKFGNNNEPSQVGLNNSRGEADESIPFDVEPSMNIESEDLAKYKNDNFVESVGKEYTNLMNELGGSKNKPSV